MASMFELQSHTELLYDSKPRQLAFRAQSAEEFAGWQHALRGKILDLLGIAGRAVPTSPRAELISVTDRGEYVEEKYALDVGEAVAAPMYVLVPKTAPPYRPIMAFHGHDPSVQNILGNYPDEATATENLAVHGNWARELARKGFLVCAVEQRGFGERITGQINSPGYPISCRHLAFDYMMQGRTLLGERCWDGMVALSYVQNRADVVKGRMGCTGHSGGGTTTLWLTAVDERVTAAVVSCYFNAFNDSILAMEHCECNYVPHILEYAEMGDLAALIAPRPLRFINGATDPIYPLAGAQAQLPVVEAAYTLLGAGDKVSLAVHPRSHAYDHGMAQEWLGRWV